VVLETDLKKGARGTGQTDPVKKILHTPLSKIGENLPPTPIPADAGTSGLPFSTARADLNDQYPYSAAGKLFFNESGQTYICSASLINSGLVVTAAHCVANFGTNAYYSDWEFHPGYRNGTSPFGAWTVARAYVLTSYLDGTDPCQQRGVVCKDDVAVLVLSPQSGSYVGKRTGWFGVGYNGAGFTQQRITHVSQLGYPACLDNAGLMQRTDSQGAVDSTHSDNTIIGSLMCGGSSGGPWLINFGLQPVLTGTQFGIAPYPNTVVGVTSWGSTNNAVKWMGASPFTTDNLKKLIDTACSVYPAACN
jgi:V8-like Glu-specific endopeptidase